MSSFLPGRLDFHACLRLNYAQLTSPNFTARELSGERRPQSKRLGRRRPQDLEELRKTLWSLQQNKPKACNILQGHLLC